MLTVRTAHVRRPGAALPEADSLVRECQLKDNALLYPSLCDSN
jgi:hypothetical protein